MKLRNILAIAGLSFLASCATISNNKIEEIKEKESIFDEFVSIKEYDKGKGLLVGHDTDKDAYEDTIEEYELVGKIKDGTKVFELIKVYGDKDRDFFIRKDELVWEKGKGQEYDMRKRFVFLRDYDYEGERIFIMGYDTNQDKDNYEDERGFYRKIEVNEYGHSILEKIGVCRDKNGNHMFEEGELEETKEEILSSPDVKNL